MDITIETALLIVVPLIGAFIVIGILNGQSNQADDFFSGQTKGAECDVQWTKYKRALNCPTPAENDASREIKDKYRSQCESPSRPFDANEIC